MNFHHRTQTAYITLNHISWKILFESTIYLTAIIEYVRFFNSISKSFNSSSIGILLSKRKIKISWVFLLIFPLSYRLTQKYIFEPLETIYLSTDVQGFPWQQVSEALPSLPCNRQWNVTVGRYSHQTNGPPLARSVRIPADCWVWLWPFLGIWGFKFLFQS